MTSGAGRGRSMPRLRTGPPFTPSGEPRVRAGKPRGRGDARPTLGLEAAELGKSVAVNAQQVSGWDTGTRPRPAAALSTPPYQPGQAASAKTMTLAHKPRAATYQDILEAPPNKVAELLAAELFLSPRPGSRQARASMQLGVSLGPFDGGLGPDDPGGWLILLEPELHLGRDVLVPDLAGWRRERMPEMPDVAAFTLAPDWVCEVASPATQRTDRLLKMPIYRRAGVPWVWIVDPLTELVEVFEGDGERWIMAASAVGAGLVRLPPFDALELDPGRWFER